MAPLLATFFLAIYGFFMLRNYNIARKHEDNPSHPAVLKSQKQFQYVFWVMIAGVVISAIAVARMGEAKNEFHPEILSREGSTLVVVSDTIYVWQPLGCFPDPDSIQLLNGTIFSVSDSAGRYKKLVYGNSMIVLMHNDSVLGEEGSAEFRYQQPDEWQIWRATIRDESIHLAAGIQLGMEMSEFVSRYVTSDTVDLAGINVINLCEPVGELIEADYKFEDGRLEEIMIRAPW